MIEVRTLKNARGNCIGFFSRGHADYAERGKDIICAAVSALELNLANSVAELTDAHFTCEINEKTGDFSFRLIDERDEKAALLLSSCLLGLEGVREEYGAKYLTITDQEV